MARASLVLFFAVAGMAFPLASVVSAAPDTSPHVRVVDANGEVVFEQYAEPGRPELLRSVEYTRIATHGQAAKLSGGGGGGVGTDCSSTAHRAAGWHWTAPFTTYASSYATEVGAALSTWDAATGRAITGGATAGSAGPAGTLDGHNQIDWVNIGASTTIAVTTTWSYRATGVAVESDGQYNTYYAWSTSGAAGTMDVLNIATHETGHTFGLDHPKGGGIGCLTMYAYANYGETQKRTLGDGDILGIRGIYGA